MFVLYNLLINLNYNVCMQIMCRHTDSLQTSYTYTNKLKCLWLKWLVIFIDKRRLKLSKHNNSKRYQIQAKHLFRPKSIEIWQFYESSTILVFRNESLTTVYKHWFKFIYYLKSTTNSTYYSLFWVM